MYIPKRAPPPKGHPMRLQQSQRFLVAAGLVAATTAIMSFGAALHYTQNRDRKPASVAAHKRRGQRVVIVGAGPGGCALAASLSNYAPNLHITVIEKERRQTFLGMIPHAHVGHRSYDLNTTGGLDSLRSPATWNVSRQAHLVMGEVVRVDEQQQRVVVRPDSMPKKDVSKERTASSSSSASPSAEAGQVSLWRRMWGKTTTCAHDETTLNDDGSRTLSDGGVAYPYDVLVIAAGAQRSLGSLAACLSSSDVDRHRIAIHPGVTRDNLGHIFQGNMLHVKVPPASFVATMEAARSSRGRPSATIVAATSTDADVLNDAWVQHCGTIPAEGAGTPAASPVMLATSRQHDGTFIGTTNLLWKYLHYFGKLSRCRLCAVTADVDPLPMAPHSVNDVVLQLWRERQDVMRSASGAFLWLRSSYLTHVDPLTSIATIYNYAANVEFRVPYRLLLLDLPLTAPAFIRRSGLHRASYAAEHPCPTSSSSAARKHKTYVDEESFVDVDPETLCHRSYTNIFAIGDAAGLPTAKSYGATLAQVPVVSHNVIQVLEHALHSQETLQREERLSFAEAKQRVVKELGDARAATTQHLRQRMAKYDGYSSFHIVMSTWRCMWPEMLYTPQQQQRMAAWREGGASRVDEVEPLVGCCNHWWNNLVWRDARGLTNGLFCQLALYELAYFFTFMRGIWHPAKWYLLPTYSVEDGSPLKGSWIAN